MPRVYLNNRFLRSLVMVVVTGSSLVGQCWFGQSAMAQTRPYCRLTRQEATEKENLRQEWLRGNSQAERSYKDILKKHGDIVQQCRQRNWPNDQAIWLRLYRCDTNPGGVEAILDSIVNRGYNQVYVEVFYDSRVLLPASDNPTPWTSVLRSPGLENVDLLAEVIQKGHQRGLEVYAWMFTMNFGYGYSQRRDRRQTLARNGRAQTSLEVVGDGAQAFIDPYHRQAQNDYYRLVQAVAKRKPDGVLFDYIRYPRGSGTQSVAGQVKDLWIYGDASLYTLFNRALNRKGRFLIERYVRQGSLNLRDVQAADDFFPDEGAPMWQGRTSPPDESDLSVEARYRLIKRDLWHLTLAHAAQGVIDFLNVAIAPLQRERITAGAVFFPDGNQPVGQTGFDSRLQPWDKFPPSLEWHGMSYGACGNNNTNCITDKVRRLVNMSNSGVKLVPAIAGVWGQPYNNRPSLERQMEAIRRVSPQIRGVSHFAYSWQYPEYDRQRKSCRFR